MPINEWNQPIGQPVDGFHPGQAVDIVQLQGQYCILQRLNVQEHFEGLQPLLDTSSPPQHWTYLPMDALPDAASVRDFLEKRQSSTDPYMLVVKDKTSGTIVGSICLMQINTTHRSVEVGWVMYGSAMKKSRIATEAQYLLMQYVFEQMQYRRYEWKCDSLNAPSRRAAERLGFKFEGIFRHAMVYKGRNRDTAWFSMLPEEFQAMKVKFQKWLSNDNFDSQGAQIKRLQDC